MQSSSREIVRQSAQFIFFDLLFASFFRFPLWWYTDGLWSVIRWGWDGLVYRWKSYNLTIWIKYLFIPMYGQYDWTGRLISLLVRIAVLIGRLIGLVVETLVYLLLVVLWAVFPFLLMILLVINLWHAQSFAWVGNMENVLWK